MLATKYRLTGKDIQFLLRKGKKIYGKTFVFIVFKQYPQRSYTQRSVQIPVKLDKRAVMRNLLKRTAKSAFVSMSEHSSLPACKVFIFVNKKSLEPFKDMIATHNKTDIVQEWNTLCKQDFTLLFSRI
jgi:ribonuclease P protein component